MKTKFLLAALALPLAFSACTQDEFENAQNGVTTVPDNAIQGLVLNVQKNGGNEDPMTKGEWIDATNSIKFTKDDKISMYWLGESDATGVFSSAFARTSITGKFNSIFHTEDGTTFSSESLVFEGGNIAVYPGNLSFVKEGTIYLEVAQDQNATTLANVPYISNQLYISKQGVNQTEQLPGYYGDAELDCPVKLAANVVNLTLNLSNIPAGYDFEVQSVELEGDANTFATKSKITTAATEANYGGEVLVTNPDTKKKTIIAQTWSEADSKVGKISTSNITKVNDKTVIAHFVVLPTNATTTTGKVIVRTNCGTITLSADDQEAVKIVNSKGEQFAINSAIGTFVANQTMDNEDSKFDSEYIGKVANRSIAVDASKAKLNGSVVYTSDDIKRYVNLHTDMGSEEATVELTLAAKEGTVFKGFKKDAADLLKTKNATSAIFSLNAGSMNAIEIVGGGEVFDITGAPAVELQLSDESWSMNDAFTFTSDLTMIVNKGTLTIKGTETNGTPNSIAEAITNKSTINLEGKLVQVASNTAFVNEANSQINIGANQELKFVNGANSGTLNGIINLNENTSILSTLKNAYIGTTGVINNSGIVAGSATEGWINYGTVNVKDANAIVYLKQNATSGKVNLMNRDNEVKADTNNGKIVYNWADGSEFTIKASDKFNYVVFNNINSLTIKNSSTLASQLASVSMEFNGLATVKAAESDNVTIKDLIITKDADFRFTTGNKLNVTNLTNNGLITIGGIITCDSFTNNGRVLTTGNGSIDEQ